jgi:hypothetical protein
MPVDSGRSQSQMRVLRKSSGHGWQAKTYLMRLSNSKRSAASSADQNRSDLEGCRLFDQSKGEVLARRCAQSSDQRPS